MDKILIVNCGSSSLKFKLFDKDIRNVIASGIVERIGQAKSPIKIKNGKTAKNFEKNIRNHESAVKFLLEQLKALKIIENFNEIKGVGHRVVAGGEEFKQSVIVNSKILQKISLISELAPLHNPANVVGIKVCQKLLPSAVHVAAFDTAFHSSMPAKNFMYSTPYEWYSKYHVRRYGAHGISHQYIAIETAKQLNKSLNQLNMISCHLGAGSSICAIKDGKSYDISMGFTPLTGLQMATRSGDVDVSLVSYIMKKLNVQSIDEMIYILNKNSGFKGVSGISSDMRDVLEAASNGNYRAQLSLDLFNNSIIRYLGQYFAELQRVDAITFTAGIGENSPETRKEVIDQLSFLGITLDSQANNVRGRKVKISGKDSSTAVYVIPTDEERMIAQDLKKLL